MLTVTIPMADMIKMAEAIVRSNMFGMKTVDQAVALMCIAQAEGMHPAIAARDYHVIQNRPALKADAMLGRFQKAGGKVEWKEYTNERVVGSFSHPQSGTIVVDWDIKRAREAGLADKENWKKFPRQMLRSRVVSEGIRAAFPGVITGFYTEEEVQDFDDSPVSIPNKKTEVLSNSYIIESINGQQLLIHDGSPEDIFIRKCLDKLGKTLLSDTSIEEREIIFNKLIEKEKANVKSS